MVLANMQFNHEIENFHQAIGISDDMRTRARERILFTSFSNALQRAELYEDEEDAPKSLRTITGDLERCLSMVTDPLEYEYTLIMFHRTQIKAMETVAYYMHISDKSLSKEDQLKIKLFEVMEEMKGADDFEDEQLIDKLTRSNMVKRIKFVKDSHHNFETYMNMLTRWAGVEPVNVPKKNNKDVDDLLNNLFSDH